jgi:DNA-binding GntR family transcriptional regulator
LDSEPLKMRLIVSLNLREQIEKEVRSAIIKGRFQPGERLIESTIATEMGVSRAPVREVLSALEREGLVVNIPRRGNFVVDFTNKDIDEIYSLRLLLEIGAMRRAMERCTPQDLDNLQRLVDDLDKAMVRQDDSESITNLDMEFHEYFCALADHSRLYTTWKSISMQAQLLIGVTSKTHYRYPHEPAQWHQTILDAFEHRDLVTTEKILTEHIMDGCERAIKALVYMHSKE